MYLPQFPRRDIRLIPNPSSEGEDTRVNLHDDVAAHDREGHSLAAKPMVSGIEPNGWELKNLIRSA